MLSQGLQGLMSAQKDLQQAAMLQDTLSLTEVCCWLQGFSKVMSCVP